METSFLPVLFGIARFAIRKWSNAKRVPDREQAKNSGAAQIIQTVAARALSDRRQRSRLLQGDGGASLNSSQIAMSKPRSEEHTSELQSHSDLVCRLLLEKKKISK